MTNKERCSKCPNDCKGFCSIYQIENSEIDFCWHEGEVTTSFNLCDPTIFMLWQSPDMYFRFMNYVRKDKLPEIGAKVFTLRAGFGGDRGEILYVDNVIDNEIILWDGETSSRYGTSLDSWWKDLCIISKEEE